MCSSSVRHIDNLALGKSRGHFVEWCTGELTRLNRGDGVQEDLAQRVDDGNDDGSSSSDLDCNRKGCQRSGSERSDDEKLGSQKRDDIRSGTSKGRDASNRALSEVEGSSRDEAADD